MQYTYPVPEYGILTAIHFKSNAGSKQAGKRASKQVSKQASTVENSAKCYEGVLVIKLYSGKAGKSVSTFARSSLVADLSTSPSFRGLPNIKYNRGVESLGISGEARNRERWRGRRREKDDGALAFGNSRPENRNFCSFHRFPSSEPEKRFWRWRALVDRHFFGKSARSIVLESALW